MNCNSFQNGFHVEVKNVILKKRCEELAKLLLAEFATKTLLRFEIPMKVCPHTSLFASSGTLNAVASCKTFALSCNSGFCCEKHFGEDTHNLALRETTERLLRYVEGTLQCDVLHVQLTDHIELFGCRPSK